MLRVGTKQIDGAFICRLEGRLTGEGAEQVRLLVTRSDSTLAIVVDLTDIMFIDAVGEDVLLFVRKLGGNFIADTSYSRDICERLQLPLLRDRQPDSQPGTKDGNGPRPGNGSGRR